MKVATFNANSIRIRLEIVLDWLAEHEPDVLAIQETKVEDDKFPVSEFEEAGWHVAIHGQKMRNGVALVSRLPIQNVRRGFEDPTWPDDCRIICGEVGELTIVNTYVPNGTAVGSDKFAYKLTWMERFDHYLRQRFRESDPFVWLGDINVAPTENDVFDPKQYAGKVGFHPDEIERLNRIRGFGLVDVFRKFHEGNGQYSFWEFVIPRSFERNLGWRIDHIYAPSSLAERCTASEIDRAPRGLERPSDHTFVWATFS